MLDIVLNRRPHTNCTNTSRRDFLRVGALAGLSLPALLQAEAHASRNRSALVKGGRAKSVVLVFLGGGISHHDSFDPKPDARTKFAESMARSTQWCQACGSVIVCRGWQR